MKDTSEWAEAKMIELYRGLSEGRRLEMACSMFDMARELVTAGIRAERPDISPVELRKELFRRFYHHDFTPERLEEIAEQLG